MKTPYAVRRQLAGDLRELADAVEHDGAGVVVVMFERDDGSAQGIFTDNVPAEQREVFARAWRVFRGKPAAPETPTGSLS